MATSTNKPSHLRALLKKNWILWKRSWCVSCLEIFVPVFFTLIVAAFRGAVRPEDIPQTSYYDKPAWSYQYDGSLTAADKAYFKNCASENGGMVALIPEGDSLITNLKSILGTFL